MTGLPCLRTSCRMLLVQSDNNRPAAFVTAHQLKGHASKPCACRTQPTIRRVLSTAAYSVAANLSSGAHHGLQPSTMPDTHSQGPAHTHKHLPLPPTHTSPRQPTPLRFLPTCYRRLWLTRSCQTALDHQSCCPTLGPATPHQAVREGGYPYSYLRRCFTSPSCFAILHCLVSGVCAVDDSFCINSASCGWPSSASC